MKQLVYGAMANHLDLSTLLGILVASEGSIIFDLDADDDDSNEIFGITGSGGQVFQFNELGQFIMSNGTDPSASVTDSVILYAIDANDGDGTSTSELYVRDEDGNETNLSPHNFSKIPGGPSEPRAWSYYSERDGEYIAVDLLKLVRLVEGLTGEQLVHTGRVDDAPTDPKER